MPQHGRVPSQADTGGCAAGHDTPQALKNSISTEQLVHSLAIGVTAAILAASLHLVCPPLCVPLHSPRDCCVVCCGVGVALLLQEALYVDVSNKPIRSYSQYADRGGAGGFFVGV